MSRSSSNNQKLKIVVRNLPWNVDSAFFDSIPTTVRSCIKDYYILPGKQALRDQSEPGTCFVTVSNTLDAACVSNYFQSSSMSDGLNGTVSDASLQVDNAIFLKMPASSCKQIHDRRVNTILTDPAYLQYLADHQNRNIDLTTTEPISKNSSSVIPSALPVTLLGVERTDNSGSDNIAPIIKFLCDKSSRKQPQKKSKKDKRPSSSKRIPDSSVPDTGAPKKIKSKNKKSKQSNAPSEKFKVLQKEAGSNGPTVPTSTVVSTNSKPVNVKRSNKKIQQPQSQPQGPA